MREVNTDVDYREVETRVLTYGRRVGMSMAANFGLVYGLMTPEDAWESLGLVPRRNIYDHLVPGLRNAIAGVRRPYYPAKRATAR